MCSPRECRKKKTPHSESNKKKRGTHNEQRVSRIELFILCVYLCIFWYVSTFLQLIEWIRRTRGTHKANDMKWNSVKWKSRYIHTPLYTSFTMQNFDCIRFFLGWESIYQYSVFVFFFSVGIVVFDSPINLSPDRIWPKKKREKRCSKLRHPPQHE